MDHAPEEATLLYCSDATAETDSLWTALTETREWCVERPPDPSTARLPLDDRDVDCLVVRHRHDGIDGVAILESVRAERPRLPVVLVPSGDVSVARRAVAADVTEYVPLEAGVETVIEHVSAAVSDARSRVEAESSTDVDGCRRDETAEPRVHQQLQAEHARLDHLLNRINGLIRDVTSDLVAGVSRMEIQRDVCKRIAKDETYEFVWIGRPDQKNGRLVPDTWDGAWICDRSDLEFDLDADASNPVVQAYETGDLQVVKDTDEISQINEEYTWLADAETGGVAAIPITYKDATYGVLTVCATPDERITDHEAVVLASLSRSIATAINAIERGRIIAADNVVELTFETTDRAISFVDLSAKTDSRLHYRGTVTQSDGATSLFFETSNRFADLRDVASAHEVVEDVTQISEGTESQLFKCTVTESGLVPTVLRRGGKPQSITVADGRAEIVVELPASSNARNLVQYLESEFPESRLVSFHEHERPPQTKQECVNNAITHLTDRQQTALKTAFLSGYYESNREVSGAELADSMDVSQSTFHQHLRAAQRKVLAAVFDDELDE